MKSIVDLVRVLFSPGEVFAGFGERPKVLLPLLAVVAAQVVLGVFNLPYVRAAMRAQIAEAGSQAAQGAAAAQQWVVIGTLVFGPLAVVLLLLVAALLLWIMVSVVGGDAKFGRLFAISIYGFVPALLLQAARVGVLALQGGPEAVRSMADLQPSLGLDLLLGGGEPGFTTALLGAVNPFGIWQLVLTAIGIQRTHDVSKGGAYTASGVAFAVMAVIGAGFAALGAANR